MRKKQKITPIPFSDNDIKIFNGMFKLSRKSKRKINKFLKDMHKWTKEGPRPSDGRIIKA